MTAGKPQPIYSDDDGEFLGCVVQQGDAWAALTIFGVRFASANNQSAAIELLRNSGLQALTGTWEYLDQDSRTWQACVIVEASKDAVRVARIPEGEFYPDTSTTYSVASPVANHLRKLTH